MASVATVDDITSMTHSLALLVAARLGASVCWWALGRFNPMPGAVQATLEIADAALTNSMTARAIIVEDHTSMREALVAFVSTITGIEVCDAVASAEEALERLDGADASVALIDISLPGMSGLELLREVKKRWPLLRCVMISGHNIAAYQKHSFLLGAEAFVAKGNVEGVRDAILAVLNGEKYVALE
jgi:CheY-like chemotaxis protein